MPRPCTDTSVVQSRITITLESGPPAPIRLRRVRKARLRAYRARCVDVRALTLSLRNALGSVVRECGSGTEFTEDAGSVVFLAGQGAIRPKAGRYGNRRGCSGSRPGRIRMNKAAGELTEPVNLGRAVW